MFLRASQDVRTAPRPIGVTIIAILGAIGSILVIIAGLIFLAMGPLFGSLGIPFLSILGGLVGVVLLVVGLLGFAVAWGLWKGKNWARWLTIIGAVVGILGGILSIGSGSSIESALVGFVVDALVIYVLMRADAKAFFGGHPAWSYAPPPPSYAPAPPPPPPSRLCPNCGKPATYIQQYQRHYCYNCKEYV